MKALGGRSEQYTKDRHVGFDTYTTLADASVSFMLYNVADQKIIESGIANGLSSVHGRLGKPLKGLIGPNAADAIKELAANQSGQPSEPRKKRWRPWSWARQRARRATAPRGTENPPHPLRPDSRRGTGPRRPAAWPVLVIPGRLLGHIREKWPAYLRPDTPGSRETFIPRLHRFHIIT